MNLLYTILPYTPLLTLGLTLLGIVIRTDRRISKLEVLMANHLHEHERNETFLLNVLKRLDVKVQKLNESSLSHSPLYPDKHTQEK